MKNYIELSTLPKNEIEAILNTHASLEGFYMCDGLCTEEYLDRRSFSYALGGVTHVDGNILFYGQGTTWTKCYMKREDYNEVMAKTGTTTPEYVLLKDLDFDEVKDIQKFFDGASVFLVTDFLQDPSTDTIKVNAFKGALREVHEFGAFKYPFRAEVTWWRYAYLQKSHYEQYKNSVASLVKLNSFTCDEVDAVMRTYENQSVFRFGSKTGKEGCLSGFTKHDGKFKFEANFATNSDSCWIKESLVEKALKRTLPEPKYIALSSLPKDNLACVLDKLKDKKILVASNYTLTDSRLDDSCRHVCTPNNTSTSGIVKVKSSVWREAYIERELYEELFSISSPEKEIEIDTDLGVDSLKVIDGILYEKGTAVELRHIIALRVWFKAVFGDTSWTLTVFVNGASVDLVCEGSNRDTLEAVIPKIFKLKEQAINAKKQDNKLKVSVRQVEEK